MSLYERRLLDAVIQLARFNARLLGLILVDGITNATKRELRYDHERLQLRLDKLTGAAHEENDQK